MEHAARWVFTTAWKPVRRSIPTASMPPSPAAAWPPSTAPPIMRDNRIVALKIPHPDMEADPILSDRFKREGGIGERLNHPNVMRVFGGRKALPHLHGHGVVPRPAAAPDHGRGQTSPRPRHPHRHRRSAGARLHPRQRRRPSRPEAGKHHGRRQRPHQAHRLRHRQRLLRAPPHLRQLHRHPRHPQLHLSRTGKGQARRRPLRHLLHGRHSLRNAHRQAALFRPLAHWRP